MENLSRSRKPNRGSSHATLSTKRTTSCNGAANLSSRTMYDDAFGGGGPTLSPRPEDYTEIFGGFHASRGSSIPVLDLPLMNDSNEFMFDVRSPRFNYADVFGGFDDLDFPASYEDLMRQANAGDDHDHDGDSSDEAWMQAETESLSEGSDHSGKYPYFSNGDYCEPIDTSMEFNISYHKANVRGDMNISNGITHVAQLRTDPEYACLIENPLQKMDKKNPPLDLADDIDLEFTSGVIKKKHLRKTVSHPSNWTTGEQTFTNDSTRREYRRTGSCSDEMFVTISNVNLRTSPSHVPPPSRPPPFVNLKNEDYQNGQQAASEGRMDDNSSPFFDVEIDASSAAAASAAAMKEAMDKAQAKLKSAKEQLERKREGVNCSTKPGSKSDGKSKKERANKTVEGSDDIKVEGVLSMDGKEDSGMKMHCREERQWAVKSHAADSLEGEKLFNAPKRFVVEKLGKESQSILESVEIDEADEWQEAAQFFELVRTDKSKTVLEQMNNEKVLVQSMKSHELHHKAKKANIGALEQQLDSDEKVEAVREDHEIEKVERDMKTAKENCERGEPTRILKPVKEVRKHKGHEKKVKAAQLVSELEDNGQSLTAGKPFENGKKRTGTDELGNCEQQINAQQKGNMVEAGQSAEQKENGKQEKQTSNSFEKPKRVKEFQKQKDEEKIWREVLEQEKHETNLEVQVENNKKQREARELEEKEEIEGTREREESAKKEEELGLEEKIWRMALEQLENEKRLKQTHLQEETERRQRKALEQEEMEAKQREAKRVDASMQRPMQVTEEEKDERQQKEVFERKESENRLRKVCEEEAIDNGIKEETVERFKEDYSIQEKEVQDTEEEVKKRVVELKETEELNGVNGVYQHTPRCEKAKKPKFAEGTRQRVEGEDFVVSDAVNNDQNIDGIEEYGEFIIEENGKEEVEFSDSEKKSDPLVKGDVGGKLNVSGMAGFEAKVSQFRKDDISDLSWQDDSVKKAGKAGNAIGQRNAEKINSAPVLGSDNDNQGLEFGYECKERFRNVKEAQVSSQLEEDGDNFVSAKASVLEAEKSIQRTAQSTERKDRKVNESLRPEEKEAERLKRERELEKERLRKIEEEREREREREKDRMAVDRATLEAYERGYVEARERTERAAVERATAEARQRAMSEVRAREKSSMETRLRAERAAVERATAEARERAVEKAMAERAAFEARERVERSMSDKFSTSRNVGMKTSSSSSDLKDQNIQRSGSFDGLRYPYSSTYNGAEGESAQRCKARLERYRRTAERAAKALEEKNMRDLIAQREQAERNRFAETLDADVKRWSSGKEGNLRALLSTLQYILGPESGWQPIPLTEVITSAAVKKAYRKATLCVHPDKLQQRGASIQHKYICEKVFDLLKEAWNKFNSEER
ncbi:auxilin-like protein 1 isoform X2 [Hibiscus syriacus]|uniref:auxilin-like protein 1 isoform X2 n=1 Tax=Hibiscus syriacus TaxID=106335 RepID=UPI001921F6E8|nr:auxilin-like protein 1 isoform X2 [Hibiscus syriacus]